MRPASASRLRALCILVLMLGTLAPGWANEPVDAAASDSEMGYLQAAALGVIEGITEFLPVSSTGHLLVAQQVMGIGQTEEGKDAAQAYAIVIQAGAILAVVGLYFTHIRRMVLGLFGQDAAGLRLAINLVVAFIPAAVVGLTFVDLIKSVLFGIWPIVIAWFVGGVVILWVDHRTRSGSDPGGLDLYELPWSKALVIGCLQCLAVWPGTSRSLVTILGGELVGLSLRSAVIFSFLLGALTLGASTAYDTLAHGSEMVQAYGMAPLATGFVFAFVSAALAVKWLVNYLKRHGLDIFGYYRIGLAVVTTLLVLSGVLQAG